jgi:anti-sigma regulatory factor (Ser/Thr protein kinase)
MQARAQGIEVSLTDFGVDRFDPRQLRTVDVNAPLEKREPGGLGLYLVMKMADAIHYEYRNRNSKITFIADRKKQDDGN